MAAKLYLNLYELRPKFKEKIECQGHWPRQAQKDVIELFEKVVSFCEQIVPEKMPKHTFNRKKYFIRN